jgi:hypothetical protein
MKHLLVQMVHVGSHLTAEKSLMKSSLIEFLQRGNTRLVLLHKLPRWHSQHLKM